MAKLFCIVRISYPKKYCKHLRIMRSGNGKPSRYTDKATASNRIEREKREDWPLGDSKRPKYKLVREGSKLYHQSLI